MSRNRLGRSMFGESVLFGLLLVIANAGLLWQTPQTGWVLLPSAVRQGEWWRLFLHPWVHVGWYHLMLDAAAFVCLFFSLDRARSRDRWMILASVWVGQGLAVWLGEPRIEALGLCGLSGIGHGLFAAVSIQWLRKPELAHTGAVLLIGLLAKTIWEVCGGNVLFALWHPGDVGTPLTLCHAGGVLAGLVSAFCLMRDTPEKEGERRGHTI